MVAAPARPNSGRQPGLVEKEPLGGPGDDRVCDASVRTPLVVPIVVKTETGAGGILDVEIDMRSSLAGGGVEMNEAGLNQSHGNPVVYQRELLE